MIGIMLVMVVGSHKRFLAFMFVKYMVVLLFFRMEELLLSLIDPSC